MVHAPMAHLYIGGETHISMSNGAFLIPTYNPGAHLETVLRDLTAACETEKIKAPTLVVDDGSTELSVATVAQEYGAQVVTHETNQGKGAALQTGLAWAKERNISFVVTLDADAQHPAGEAMRLYRCSLPLSSLVLGVRDLKSAGAPQPSQFSNRFSNITLSLFGGLRLQDTQCGLRRYPVEETLALGAKHPGFAFEADVVLRAARRGLPIAHLKTEVFYPSPEDRLSYFDSLKDPAQIVLQVVLTTLSVPHYKRSRRFLERFVLGVLVCALLWPWFR